MFAAGGDHHGGVGSLGVEGRLPELNGLTQHLETGKVEVQGLQAVSAVQLPNFQHCFLKIKIPGIDDKFLKQNKTNNILGLRDRSMPFHGSPYHKRRLVSCRHGL